MVLEKQLTQNMDSVYTIVIEKCLLIPVFFSNIYTIIDLLIFLNKFYCLELYIN